MLSSTHQTPSLTLPKAQGKVAMSHKAERSYSADSDDLLGLSSSENLAMLSTADDLAPLDGPPELIANFRNDH